MILSKGTTVKYSMERINGLCLGLILFYLLKHQSKTAGCSDACSYLFYLTRLHFYEQQHYEGRKQVPDDCG